MMVFMQVAKYYFNDYWGKTAAQNDEIKLQQTRFEFYKIENKVLNLNSLTCPAYPVCLTLSAFENIKIEKSIRAKQACTER